MRRGSRTTLPLLLLLGAVTAAALFGSFGGDDPPVSPSEPREECPSDLAECRPAEAPPAPLSAPSVAEGPILDAETVCRDAGYLCAELGAEERLPIRRWKDFEGTLVVQVPRPDHEDPEVAIRLQRAATAGVRAWNGQPFPILVDERGTREAHVRVEWTPSLSGNQIGRAETSWSLGRGLRAERLVLRTRSPFNPQATISADQVRLTAAHEMGHVLGLPHSDEPRDVMYPSNTAASLTTRDYRTLEALYDLEDGAVLVRR